MIKNATLFGQFAGGGTLEKISMDIICLMREDNFHNGDFIIQLGEISDRLYFVTKGKVGVYVSKNSGQYYLDECENGEEEEDQEKLHHLMNLNVGSNFNHLCAILSQQSILTFRALGTNTQVASISKD